MCDFHSAMFPSFLRRTEGFTRQRPSHARTPAANSAFPVRSAAFQLQILPPAMLALFSSGARRSQARARARAARGAAVTCFAEAPENGKTSSPKSKKKFSPFCTTMKQWRGQTGRGKKGHFHLLDRYIRRIDALLPEDMEDLVRPMSYKPNQEKTTRSVKITFPDDLVDPGEITEDEVKAFLAPVGSAPSSIALGWKDDRGNAEVFVLFEDNDACRVARQTLDGQKIGGRHAQVRFTVDNKFRRVMEDLGFWEKDSGQLDQLEQPVEQQTPFDSDCWSLARIEQMRLYEEKKHDARCCSAPGPCRCARAMSASWLGGAATRHVELNRRLSRCKSLQELQQVVHGANGALSLVNMVTALHRLAHVTAGEKRQPASSRTLAQQLQQKSRPQRRRSRDRPDGPDRRLLALT
ncbi:unnamed protein product [Durusdinium trenchii]|uniref:RRM domain-containing protein n=1 Tax=Durusdinium trenchii TaxID=1381693 RepID=A0ABP0Q3F5_9DINO